MDLRKWTFNNLNSFVDQLYFDLNDSEKSFCNQALGIIEMTKINTRNRTEMESFCNRFNNLKMVQEAIDYTSACVQNFQSRWENLILTFENKSENECAILEDSARASIYRTAELIFVTLSNCYEAMEKLESKAKEHNEENKTYPFYAFFTIMNSNLSLLEKLFLQVLKAETYLNCNRHILYQMTNRYYCNQRIY